MNGKDSLTVGVCIAGGFVGFVFGMVLGGGIMFGQVTSFMDSAVERGYAEYNSQTGKWQWKESE